MVFETPTESPPKTPAEQLRDDLGKLSEAIKPVPVNVTVEVRNEKETERSRLMQSANTQLVALRKSVEDGEQAARAVQSDIESVLPSIDALTGAAGAISPLLHTEMQVLQVTARQVSASARMKLNVPQEGAAKEEPKGLLAWLDQKLPESVSKVLMGILAAPAKWKSLPFGIGKVFEEIAKADWLPTKEAAICVVRKEIPVMMRRTMTEFANARKRAVDISPVIPAYDLTRLISLVQNPIDAPAFIQKRLIDWLEYLHGKLPHGQRIAVDIELLLQDPPRTLASTVQAGVQPLAAVPTSPAVAAVPTVATSAPAPAATPSPAPSPSPAKA